jgi:hypothetical protein
MACGRMHHRSRQWPIAEGRCNRVHRLVVAGGETSGAVVDRLGIPGSGRREIAAACGLHSRLKGDAAGAEIGANFPMRSG